MNNERRKQLKAIAKQLGTIADNLEEQQILLEQIYDDKSEAFDNMPESLQESDRGIEMEEGIAVLEEQKDAVATMVDDIRDIIETLQDFGSSSSPSSQSAVTSIASASATMASRLGDVSPLSHPCSARKLNPVKAAICFWLIPRSVRHDLILLPTFTILHASVQIAVGATNCYRFPIAIWK